MKRLTGAIFAILIVGCASVQDPCPPQPAPEVIKVEVPVPSPCPPPPDVPPPDFLLPLLNVDESSTQVLVQALLHDFLECLHWAYDMEALLRIYREQAGSATPPP